jgi:hypothetical protein
VIQAGDPPGQFLTASRPKALDTRKLLPEQYLIIMVIPYRVLSLRRFMDNPEQK